MTHAELYRGLFEPKPFNRPDSSVFFRISNKLLPPAPTDQSTLRYGNLKRLFRFTHYLMAVPLLGTFFALVALQIRLIPYSNQSPLTLAVHAAVWYWDKTGFPYGLLALVPAYGVWLALKRRVKKRRAQVSVGGIGFLNSMSVLEEQWFREGSENWTPWQRFRSCVSFGFAHMANLYYPFCTILPLSLCGYVFMRVYLRDIKRAHNREQAVLAAALVHRVYNRVALSVAVVALGYQLLHFVIGWTGLSWPW
ncbi:MAG: hypothetical protein JWN38_1138 [Candidatus Saccharibacteria bacterium]|nr:hypothetical protein [Candidatus Saccharibacteria bacterium]